MTWAIWITGLPGSGKTVIAEKLKSILKERGIDADAKVLELDEIRKFITSNPSYSEEERDIVYASLVYMAKLLVECGKNVIIDATANRRRYRNKARESIKKFAEVYVKCSLDTCMKRERGRKGENSQAPFGIYEKGLEKGATVPGVNIPYEEPEKPEVVVDSEEMNVEQSAEKIAEFIRIEFL
jgi:adenylylsulfate kinase